MTISNRNLLVRTPPCPRSLSPRARSFWRSLASHLVKRRVLTRANLTMLEILVEALARREQLAEEAARGLFLESDAGRIPSPAVDALRETSSTIREYASDFGLPVNERGSIQIRPDDSRGIKGPQPTPGGRRSS